MGRMIEMIKQSKIPATLMRSAARGALSVAPGEMVEILVYLTTHTMFGKEASVTLAGWNEESLKAVVSDPQVSPEVLEYFLAPENLRLHLLTAMLGNPAVTDETIVRLAMQASSRVIANMLWHPRVLASSTVLHAISMNVNLPEEDGMVVRSALANLGENTDYLIEQAQLDAEAAETAIPNEILDAELDRYTREHADEITSEEGKAFEFFVAASAPAPQKEAVAAGAVISGAGEVPALVEKALSLPAGQDGKTDAASMRRRATAFQKVAQLNVGGRIQLAMKGNRDERFILIRDGSKVVSAAVLESPKLTDQEIETFASMRNVQEGVLRGISAKRKFMRSYVVQKNLCNNPRTPLDITLPLLKGLMINDLRGMSHNKNVNDTLRKVATKLYKQRTEKKSEE